MVPVFWIRSSPVVTSTESLLVKLTLVLMSNWEPVSVTSPLLTMLPPPPVPALNEE